MRKHLLWIVPVAAALLIAVGVAARFAFIEVEEFEDITPARPQRQLFKDDVLADKTPAFISDLIDSRTIRSFDGSEWEINASAAVIGLDIEDITEEPALLRLYPSYADAAAALQQRYTLLPSINLLDGKAKQFDDGLYAALDAGVAVGDAAGLPHVEPLVRALAAKLPADDEARAWILGGLKVGELLKPGEEVPTAASEFAREFAQSPDAKPIAFYNWSDELQRTFRLMRYYQQPLLKAVALPPAQALNGDVGLMQQYDELLGFYARLSNPFVGKTLKDVTPDAKPQEVFHLLPPSTSREFELFQTLYGVRIPAGADLMQDFVDAIRSGRVDLQPRDDSGWYDYQVYALETFLLPGQGAEDEKLLLTKRYKQRLLEAFKALVTKRRETHVRQLAAGSDALAMPQEQVSPRLRIEPNPSYYLRQARAYDFLQTFLQATVGEGLQQIRGRKDGGLREAALGEELAWMRQYFYGLHLIACEDIGMRPDLLAGELSDAAADECYATAEAWLEGWADDPDLAVDTRVVVPVFNALRANKLHLWSTIGVRGAKLKTWYARPPQWREKGAAESTWQDIESWQTEPARYVVLVDEFAQYKMDGLVPPTRQEFRALCNRGSTKEEVLGILTGDAPAAQEGCGRVSGRTSSSAALPLLLLLAVVVLRRRLNLQRLSS